MLTTTAPIAGRHASTPPPGPPVVDVRGLTKRYGDRSVVSGVDLTVGQGEIVGILGHNGAGKTTTVECAQGLRAVDGGSVAVLGLDPLRQRAQLGSRVGSQLQESALPDRLKVGEALRLFADGAVDRDWVDGWGLADLWDQAFATLSGGQQQRLFIALALVNRPEVVFLDELTQGLDPVARRDIWAAIERVRAEGTTVVLVTHFIDEAEALCDRLVVMSGGSVVAEGTPAGLVERFGPGVGVRYTDPTANAATLRAVPGVTSVALSGAAVELRGSRPMIAHLGAHLVRDHVGHGPPADIHVIEPTLEDAVLHLMANGQ